MFQTHFTHVLLTLLSLTTVVNAGLLDMIGFGSGPPAQQRQFSFGQQFVGTWSITRQDRSMIDGEVGAADSDNDISETATYNILSENYTTALVGSYNDMDGEVGHLVRVEFEDDSLNAGKFYTSGPNEDADSEWLEEGDDDALLFDFDFSEIDVNKLHHSAGIWRSQTTKSGWYNFVFYGTDTFVLNVVPHDSEGSAFFIRGARVKDEVARVEQPWWSRMMMPLSMFFLLRRFLPGNEEPARAAAPAPATETK